MKLREMTLNWTQRAVLVAIAICSAWPVDAFGQVRPQKPPTQKAPAQRPKVQKPISPVQRSTSRAIPNPPPKSPPPASDLPIKGLSSYYGRFRTGYELDSLLRNDPANTNSPIADQKHKLQFLGVLGWGPIRANDLFFNIHYTYRQDWSTNQGQASQFFDRWFSSPSEETFLFRTQDLLRTHELAADLRYLHPYFQAGFFSRISIGRVGSSLLGADFEESRTVVKTENFVPYVTYRYGKYYRGQLSLPFRTEINEDIPRLSNATYSYDGRGRGFLLSYDLNNGIFIPTINSLVFLDLFYHQFKYASIQNDRSQIGTAISFDFPVIWRIRAAPKIVYHVNSFIADRVRIQGAKRGESLEADAVPSLIPREDNFFGAGGSIYYDYDDRHRFAASFAFNTTTSTIPEFNIVQEIYTLNYTYSWPRTSLLQKRVQRFQENTFAEEF
jgi:hypothetical protein